VGSTSRSAFRPPAGLATALLLLAGCGSQASSGNGYTMTGAADHAKRFPISSADLHGPNVAGGGGPQNYCNACHATATTPPAPADSFKTFNCVGCHVQVAAGSAYHDDELQVGAIHVSVTGFHFSSTACYACHPDGTGAPANHGALFPIGSASAHRAQKCGDCHLDRTQPHDLTKYACDSCHLNRTRRSRPSTATPGAWRS
jgi:hypothetical protein